MKRFIFLLTAIFMCTIARSDEITINWLNTDKTIDHTTTCTIGGDVILPQTPYKYGYTFNGWRANYTPIEYLGFTGTQYIDTGVNLSNYHTIDITVNANKLGGVMGRYLGAEQSFQIYDGYCRFGNYNYTGSISQYEHKTVNIRYGQTGLYVNNVLLATPSQQTFTQTGTGTCLVGHYGGIDYNFSGKIYGAQIYDRNNTLVRDMIPVLDYDGTPCMYDKVEGKFYYNARTGDFIAGPVITD